MNKPANISKMNVDIIELNQIIPENINNPANKYIIYCDNCGFSNHIYNNTFPKIADPIYHPMSIKLLIHHTVIANQLPSVLICIDFTLHPVNKANNECQNSCKKVTNKLIGYTM
jgi:hypothetical protein